MSLTRSILVLIAGYFYACQVPNNEPSERVLSEDYYKAYQIMYSEPLSSITLLEDISETSSQRLLPAKFSEANNLLAYIYEDILDQPTKAMQWYMKNLYRINPQQEPEIYLKAMYDVGGLYYRMSYLRTATKVFAEGLLISDKFRNSEFEGKFSYYLAIANMELNSFEKAKHFLERAIKISLASNDTISLINTSSLKACILTKENNFVLSSNLLENLLDNYPLNSFQLLAIHNNLGQNYLSLDSLFLAKQHLANAIELTKELNKPSRITLNNLGKLALKKKEFMVAKKYYEQAELLPTTSLQDEDQLETFEGLVEVYTSLGENAKALNYKQKAIDHMKPIINQVDELRVFASMYEEWDHSREVISKEQRAEIRIIAAYVFFIVAAILFSIGIYDQMAYKRRLKLESEIRLLREIDELKQSIIYNIRMLF